MPVRTSNALLLVLLLAVAATAAEEKPRTLDQVLQGKILSLKKDEIEIFYDFSHPVQKEDWIGFKPFRVLGELTAKVEAGALHMNGTGALHHRATFLHKVSIELDVTPRADRDLGIVVSEDAESEQYVLYSINDYYFQKWDGAKAPGHMICRFGVKDAGDKDGWKAFRYISRSKTPAVPPHRQVHVLAGKDRREAIFLLGEKKMSGRDMGREMRDLLIGPYLVKSSMVVRSVTVRGRLSPRWLEKENVALALSEPIVEETGPSQLDLEARSKVERFRSGTALPDEILEVVENAEISGEIREEAADALITSGKKSLVPRALSLLYSEEYSTRKLGAGVIKGLTGKTFGYDPGADEAKRSRAIQKLVKHMQKNPREFR